MNLPRMLPGIKIPAVVVMAVVLGLALTGGILAANGAISNAEISSDGTIHACYVPHKNPGENQRKLRVVNDADKCKKSEVHIAWSVEGGGGGTGPPGPAGAAGPPGPGAEPTPASAVELRGPVIGSTNGTTGSVTEIVFPIGLVSGGPVDLTPGATKIQYNDASQSITSTTPNRFETIPVSGADSDLILEINEIIEIKLLDLDFFLDLVGSRAGSEHTIHHRRDPRVWIGPGVRRCNVCLTPEGDRRNVKTIDDCLPM